MAKGWCGWQGSPCARGAQGQAWGSYSPWPDSAKPHIAWSVCRGCPSSPRGYHTFLSCLQNAVTTNCKNQPHPHLIRVKPAQLCTTSPACPVLCVLLQATAIAQACCHLLLSGCFSTADSMAHEDGWWPRQPGCSLPQSLAMAPPLAEAGVAFLSTDGCSKAEGVGGSLMGSS